MISVAVPDAVQQVQQGSLRGLAVSGATRAQALPNVPTLSEAGFSGFVAQGWIALFAPAGIPPQIAEALNDAVNDVLQTAGARERLAALGFTANVKPFNRHGSGSSASASAGRKWLRRWA